MSIADEIKKLKNLLDEGTLTQDEFEKMKKDLISKDNKNTSQIKPSKTTDLSLPQTKKAPKGCMIGCLSLLILIFVSIIIGILNSPDKNNKTVDTLTPVLDVEQFSLVNQAFVKERLGEPKSVDAWNYQSPSTGINNALTTLDYDWEGYYSEFIFDDKNRLIRINIYAGDNDKSAFTKTTFKDLLKQLNITPGENLTKAADTGSAWRYERISEKVDEVWELDELGEENKIGIIKISFDVRPFL